MFNCPWTADSIVYFGIPKIFTFGFQIGAIVSTTCEETVGSAGRNGWPCWLKRLGVWTDMWLSGKDGYDRVEFAQMWTQVLKYVGFELIVLGVCLIPILCSERKQEFTQREIGDEEKGGKKGDVAAGSGSLVY